MINNIRSTISPLTYFRWTFNPAVLTKVSGPVGLSATGTNLSPSGVGGLDNGHHFKAFEIDTSLDCGIPETLLSTNRILLKRRGDNAIHKTVIINNSHLSHCTVSENCRVEGSKLINVIILPGSKVLHQNIDNAIVGHDKVIEKKSMETIKN